jgi:hypothetical protein
MGASVVLHTHVNDSASPEPHFDLGHAPRLGDRLDCQSLGDGLHPAGAEAGGNYPE